MLPQALEAACLEKNVSKVQVLLGDFHYQPEILAAVLLLACERNLADIVKLVLANAGKLEELLSTKDASNNNPIHIACKTAAFECVKALIEEGNDCPTRMAVEEDPTSPVKVKAISGITPLHAACAGGSLAIVKYLHGLPNVNLECYAIDGTTPLHLACVYDAVEVVKYFVEHAPKLLSHQSSQGYTPLGTTAAFGASKCTTFLLKRLIGLVVVEEDEIYELFVTALTSKVTRSAGDAERCQTLECILEFVNDHYTKIFATRIIRTVYNGTTVIERPVHICARFGMYEPHQNFF